MGEIEEKKKQRRQKLADLGLSLSYIDRAKLNEARNRVNPGITVVTNGAHLKLETLSNLPIPDYPAAAMLSSQDDEEDVSTEESGVDSPAPSSASRPRPPFLGRKPIIKKFDDDEDKDDDDEDEDDEEQAKLKESPPRKAVSPKPLAKPVSPKPLAEEPKPQAPPAVVETKKEEPKKEPRKEEKKEIPEEPKKERPKDSPKNVEVTKEEPKKESPKKVEATKEEPKKEEVKKVESKKEEPKKEEPKKEEPKEQPKKEELQEESYEERMAARAERRKQRELESTQRPSSVNLTAAIPTTTTTSNPTARPQTGSNRGSAANMQRRSFVLVNPDKCEKCEAPLYPLEKFELDGKKYHKTCFKCDQCKKVLTTGEFEGLGGKYYCKPHAKQARESADKIRPRAVSNPKVDGFRPLTTKLQSVEGIPLLSPLHTHKPISHVRVNSASYLQQVCHGYREEAQDHREGSRPLSACCRRIVLPPIFSVFRE